MVFFIIISFFSCFCFLFCFILYGIFSFRIFLLYFPFLSFFPILLLLFFKIKKSCFNFLFYRFSSFSISNVYILLKTINFPHVLYILYYMIYFLFKLCFIFFLFNKFFPSSEFEISYVVSFPLFLLKFILQFF